MPTLSDLINTLVNFIIRYALPRSMRRHLFVRHVSILRNACGPAAFLREHGLMAYMMQVDIFHKYYRI